MRTPTPESQQSAVTRTVSDDGDRHVVTLAQTFPVEPWSVYGALASPQRLSSWFGELEGRLVAGERFALPEREVSGVVDQAVVDEYVHVRWSMDGDASSLELLLSDEVDGTRLTIRHTVEDSARWASLGPAPIGLTWDLALYALAMHLHDDSVNWADRLRSFTATADGREFLLTVIRFWAAAHVASGADRLEARSAASRTAMLRLDEVGV